MQGEWFYHRSVKILRFPWARPQLPRKAKTAFLRDLRLALFPQESTYFDYATIQHLSYVRFLLSLL